MAKPKKVSYELITINSPAGEKMYPLMNRLIEESHEELTDARIALAWNTSWKPDKDGRVTLGKCKKATDLDRELYPYDFVIMLQRDFYEDGEVTDHQRSALIDHELSHAAVTEDPLTGDPIIDERGRKVYRLRKHDVEEFSSIIARYGTYKRDLEDFAQALNAAKKKSADNLLIFEKPEETIDEPQPAQA